MERPADTRTNFDTIDHRTIFVPAHHDVILPALFVQARRPRISGRLHDDHAANLLPLLVSLVNERVRKGTQEASRAKL